MQTVGARLHVREVGDGLPILVLHGGPDFDHEYLLPDLDRLADLGRLVYYDRRGRGRSYSGRLADDVSMETEVADLDRVRDWTGSPSVALLGHSWGALLALEYAIRHPGRVSHLVLMNAGPVSHADFLDLRRHVSDIRPAEQQKRMDELRSSAAYLAGDLGADAEYHRLHFASAVRRPAHLEQVIGQLRRGFTAEGLRAARAIEDRLYQRTWLDEDYDLLPQLRQLRIPTLVLHGDQDLVPVEVARRIAGAMPHARLVVLPDCGHFAFLEQPDAVHAAVTEFLVGGR